MSLFFLALASCCVLCCPWPSGSLPSLTRVCPAHPFPWALILDSPRGAPGHPLCPKQTLGFSSVFCHCCSFSSSSVLLPHARGSVSFHAPPQITPRALVAVTVWRGTRWTKRRWDLTTRARQRSTTLRKVSRGARCSSGVRAGVWDRAAGAVGHCALGLQPAAGMMEELQGAAGCALLAAGEQGG